MWTSWPASCTRPYELRPKGVGLELSPDGKMSYGGGPGLARTRCAPRTGKLLVAPPPCKDLDGSWPRKGVPGGDGIPEHARLLLTLPNGQPGNTALARKRRTTSHLAGP